MSLLLGISLAGTTLSLLPIASYADVVGAVSADSKRDIHNTFDSENKMDQGIPTTPMDLMERLRRASQLDDATSPSEALDEALKAFMVEREDSSILQ